MSAAGLLGRRYTYQASPDPGYTGARKGHPAVVQFLTGKTPNTAYHDIYTNKHISLLAYMEGSSFWDPWYAVMSTYLQANQETALHQHGSWYLEATPPVQPPFPDPPGPFDPDNAASPTFGLTQAEYDALPEIVAYYAA